MDANPQISVIVPVYNDYKRLALCLAALVKQEGDIATQIIVVDNDSKTIDEAVVKHYNSYENVEFLTETKPGSYAARNKGLKCVTGSIVAFTDSDCIPEPDWLSQSMEILTKQDIQLIAGNVKIFFETDQKPSWLEVYESALAFPQEQNAILGRSVTANLIVRKAVVDAIGGFQDDSYSGADYEFTSRAVSKGHLLVYGNKCIVKHPARRSMEKIHQKLRRIVGGFYMLRYDDPAMARQFTWKVLLHDAAPPIQAFQVTKRKQHEIGLSNFDILKVVLLAAHIKWYRLWLKLKLKLGLKGFIGRC